MTTVDSILCVHRVSVVKNPRNEDHRDALNTENFGGENGLSARVFSSRGWEDDDDFNCNTPQSAARFAQQI